MSAPLTLAPEHYGRYRLIERIGKGGMAEVFRAYVEGFEGFRNTFVIKRIRSEKSDSVELIELFCNEARICALLHHANIVEVYDFGQIGGAYFMAMEYLRGRDLAAVMRASRLRLSAVPPLVAAHVARQVALGLDHAHHAKLADGRPAEIVHRDVTPSNIMLLAAGGVKVLDFGIAKTAETARPTVAPRSRIKGKLAYLSPEQVRGVELDGRSDVFSLGVVLWEMLAGQRLFAGESEFQTLRNVLTQPVPPPSSKRPDIPAALDLICARALERERVARPGSAGAFAAELAAVLPATPDGAEGVAALLEGLFGDGAIGEQRDRMMSSFTAQSESPGSEPPIRVTGAVPTAAAPAASAGNADGASWTQGPRPAPGRGRVAVLVVALVALALALGAWRLVAVSRAAPGPSRSADTANAGK
jgi:serine/threonine protein kinase